jgi:F0F1-type ATP synthase alpha subunit
VNRSIHTHGFLFTQHFSLWEGKRHKALHNIFNQHSSALRYVFFFDIGIVVNVGDGIAKVLGLYNVRASEMLAFCRNLIHAMALNLAKIFTGVLIFGHDKRIVQGDLIRRLNFIVSVPVGLSLLGRVIDALGSPVDNPKMLLRFNRKSRVEIKAPGIMPRESVNVPLQTGIKAIDCLVPIGRGQRDYKRKRIPANTLAYASVSILN